MSLGIRQEAAWNYSRWRSEPLGAQCLYRLPVLSAQSAPKAQFTALKDTWEALAPARDPPLSMDSLASGTAKAVLHLQVVRAEFGEENPTQLCTVKGGWVSEGLEHGSEGPLPKA